MRRKSATGLALALAIGCGGTAGTGPVERVAIPRGASFSEVLDSLERRGLVRDRLWARLIGRLAGFHRRIKPGVYEFTRGTSTLRILADLRDGRFLSVRLTVPEGLTVADIAALAARELGIPRDSFLAAARDTTLLRAHGVEAGTAEGFLAPETYVVPLHSTARELAEMMLAQFARTWQPDWDTLARQAALTRLEVVTLASIVEGEARVDEERPIIAGVYLNRLRHGMPLQADPTVQYAIQQRTGERKTRLYNSDYALPSPYNTYLRRGLPPGPVGSPGRRSLEAVLRPAEVPYLFFVAGPDGRHIFSRTYADHLRAVARVRREGRR
jgi:UPF0755 protein